MGLGFARRYRHYRWGCKSRTLARAFPVESRFKKQSMHAQAASGLIRCHWAILRCSTNLPICQALSVQLDWIGTQSCTQVVAHRTTPFERRVSHRGADRRTRLGMKPKQSDEHRKPPSELCIWHRSDCRKEPHADLEILTAFDRHCPSFPALHAPCSRLD